MLFTIQLQAKLHRKRLKLGVKLQQKNLGFATLRHLSETFLLYFLRFYYFQIFCCLQTLMMRANGYTIADLKNGTTEKLL